MRRVAQWIIRIPTAVLLAYTALQYFQPGSFASSIAIGAGVGTFWAVLCLIAFWDCD